MALTPMAVIFDLDGCLVDSEPLSIGAVVDEVHAMGRPEVTFEDIRGRFLGVSMGAIYEELTGPTNRKAQQDFVDRVEARLFKVYEKKLKTIAGVVDLLSALQSHGIAVALATGGSIRRMNETLKVSSLAPWFEGTAFSSDQVDNGKPAPDLFLYAAHELGVPANACVVLEDSPHGVQGAVAAGMCAIGFVGGSHLDSIREKHARLLMLKGAQTVVTSMSSVKAAIFPPEMRG